MQLNVFSGRFDMRQLLGNRSFIDEETAANLRTIVRTPADPFFHDHSISLNAANAEKGEMWFDFVADVGDGFDSSYAIARLLAQPGLQIQEAGARSNCNSLLQLPRGEILIIGGDLAYPRPTHESFEQRFVRVMEDAMPPPLGSPAYDQEHDVVVDKKSLRSAILTAQRGHATPPPMAYVVPGNHDWFDGLNCFLRYIVYRDYLGGWLLPQRKSYFALRLPQNWWLFGMDQGLEADIDPQQAAYFGALAATLEDEAKVIIVAHYPSWVMDPHTIGPNNGQHRNRTEKHIGHLMDTVLKGKVRLRLCGDVHNYQRHVPIDANPIDPAPSVPASSSTATAPGGNRRAASSGPVPIGPTLVIAGGGGAFLHPTHCLGHNELIAVAGTGGKNYRRAAAYPTSKVSSGLAIQNLYKFRRRNILFDAIGGLLYLGLAHPLFAMCNMADMHALVASSSSWSELAASFFYDTFISAIPRAFAGSKLSCFVAVALWIGCIKFVDSYRVGVQVALGSLHAVAHLLCATGITVLIDLIFASLNKFGTLGDGGLHMQWDMFNAKYPEGVSMVHTVGNWTFGASTSLLRNSMLVADSSQTQFILRELLCNATKADGHAFTADDDDGQAFMLYMVLRHIWYWVLACPVVATVVALYLWISLRFLGLHWNEGFSSLQHTGYKSFVRLRIRQDGDLELYAIGLDRSPSEWVLDEAHKQEAEGVAEAGATEPPVPFHCWKNPSLWVEFRRSADPDGGGARSSSSPKVRELAARIVDRDLIRSRHTPGRTSPDI